MTDYIQRRASRLPAIFVGLLLAISPQVRATITTNSTTFSVGIVAADNLNKAVSFTNVGDHFVMTSGGILIGSAATFTTAGGNGNIAIVSNATITTTANSIVGGSGVTAGTGL